MSDSKLRPFRTQVILFSVLAILIAVPGLCKQAPMVKIDVGDSRDAAVDFYGSKYGVSRGAIERWIRGEERSKDLKVIDEVNLPEGTLLDFYKVRNHSDPAKRVEFQGRGELVNAYSYFGKHLKEMLFGLLNTEKREAALALLRQGRDQGFMIVPTAVGGRGGIVNTAAAQTITAIVIIPEFPQWNDPRPMSDGNTSRSLGADMYYELGDPRAGRLYPMDNTSMTYVDPIYPPGAQSTFPGISIDQANALARSWYADSPGGTLQGGIPIGLTANTDRWNGTPGAATNTQHPRRGGVEQTTQFALTSGWFDKIFNQGFATSLTNYYWQNSHGHVRLDGSSSHIIGWQTDHHVLDRIPDPVFGGSGLNYAVQPGTPLLRPTNVAGPDVVSASFHSEGLTLLFKRDVTSASGTISAYTSADTDNQTSGTQTGTVTLNAMTVTIDPWDNRRVTWHREPLQFDNDPRPEVNLIDFVAVSNQTWSANVSVSYLAGGSYSGTVNSAGFQGQLRGSSLPAYMLTGPGTTFNADDIVETNTHAGTVQYVGSSRGNRLKSFCYYVHDHRFSATASAYQLAYCQTSGNVDYIAGSDTAAGRRDRPAPFDHDRNDDLNYANGGAVLGGGHTPGHSAGAMRGDVHLMLADRGISYAGYDHEIFVYPTTISAGEGDAGSEITPHASGNVLTIPQSAGMTLIAHEFGHTLGLADLYDNDLYANANNPSPYFFECQGAGPYSVMAHGVRVDPWHKMLRASTSWEDDNGNSVLDPGEDRNGNGVLDYSATLTNGPWISETPVTANLGFTQIGQIETTLQDPVVLKLPAHPLAMWARKQNSATPTIPGMSQSDWDALIDPNQWREYYLLENRNLNGANYFNDGAPRGLYIWHIDERGIGPFQSNENPLTVVPVQADGLNELQNNGVRAPFGGFQNPPGPGDLLGDPFPGRWNNSTFTERSTLLGSGALSPTSFSNGAADTGGRTIKPGTPTDSFVRVTNISGVGNPMTASIYVEPAEVVVTSPGHVVVGNPQIPQGTPDVEMLWLRMTNSGTYPNVSTRQVTINTIKVYEIGTSLDPGNVAVAKLYADNNDNGVIDLPGDTLLKTATVQPSSAGTNADHILFTNLGYVVPLGEDRDFIVAYDIAVDADIDPNITLGAGLTDYTFVVPNQPGAVQLRTRTDGGAGTQVNGGPGYQFGGYRFPINENTATIVEDPDVLTVSVAEDLHPDFAAIDTQNVPMMQLELRSDQDSVTVTDLVFNQTGTAAGGSDVSLIRVYHDQNGNAAVDPGETLLGEATVIGGSGAGVANIGGLDFTVTDPTPQYLVVTVNIPPGADYTTPADITVRLTNAGVTVKTSGTNSSFWDTVAAFDVSAGATEIVQYLPSGENIQPNPPQPPFVPNGATVEVATAQPTLSWQAPTDPNPEDVPDNFVYEVQISTTGDWGDTAHILPIVDPVGGRVGPGILTPTVSLQIIQVTPIPDHAASTLMDNTRYYWRARVLDRQTPDGLYSNWTGTQQFLVNNQNQPPNQPNTGFSPQNGVTVGTQKPTLRCNQAFDPDPSDQVTWPTWPANALTYIYQLSTDVNFGSVAYQYTQVGNASVVFVDCPVIDNLTDQTTWYWRVKARDDENAESGWSTIQSFYVDTGNQAPTLAPPGGDYRNALSPKYGGLLPPTNFEFHVIYSDPEGDAPPDGVWLEVYDRTNTLLQRLAMQKLNPTSNNYTGGVEYIRGVSAADLAIGKNTFRFLAQGDTVEWPPLPGPNPTTWGEGPIIGTPSTLTFTYYNAGPPETWLPVPAVGTLPDDKAYEEGDIVYVELVDLDKAGAVDPVTVTISTNPAAAPGVPLDVETVTLTEDPLTPGTYHGQLQTTGALGTSSNGTLNVNAGAGHTITASYRDPNEGADFPPTGTRDTSQDTARVRDDVAPAALATVPPYAVNGLNAYGNHDGRSIDLNWSTYVAPPDVAGFKVYFSSTGPFDNTTLAAGLMTGTVVQVADLGAAARQRTITGYGIMPASPANVYHVAVVPYDELPQSSPFASIAVTVVDDQAPRLVAVDPTSGQTEVVLNTHIIYRLPDPGWGVDVSTVRTYITAGTDPEIEVQHGVNGWSVATSGTPALLTFDWTPPAGFLRMNQQVRVRVTCSELAPGPNTLDGNYTFWTKTDVEGPEIINWKPVTTAGQTVPRNSDISFDLTDNVAGINVSTLQVRVNGTLINNADLVIDASDPLDVSVTYPAPPVTVVPWNAAITVQVTVQDWAGNALRPSDPFSWTYNVEVDNVAPAITNLNPAAGAANVPIDTDISFTLTDAKSGIDAGSLHLYVNGSEVTPVTTGTQNSLGVSFSPPVRFDYNEAVTVRVEVDDFAGNALPDESPVINASNGFEWRFTCQDPPTYRIIGTIRDQDNAPLATVKVHVLDINNALAEVGVARSDGNGTFSFGIQLGGDFRLVPELIEYDFAPLSLDVTVVDADVMNQNFIGTLRTYTLRGTITQGGVGVAGVTVSDGTRTAVTAADGTYTLLGVPSGRYTVTPQMPNTSFRPTSRTVVVEGANVDNVDFEAIPGTYTVGGTVRDFDGNRIQGVRVTDGTRSTVTNEAGQFTLGDVPAGPATLTCSKTGYTFVPATRQVTVPPSATGVDFTGYISYANSFPVGVNVLNFMGVPAYPANEDPTVVFGTNALARWNAAGTPPAYVMPGGIIAQDVLDVRPGRGFFVKLSQGDLEIPGRPVSTVRPFTMTLAPVWNMAANPFTSALPFANIVPAIPGSIRNYGYTYDPISRGYLLISATPGVNVARTEIYPWEGIWLRTAAGSATANVTPAGASGSAVAVEPQQLDLGAEGWALPIVATAAGSTDSTTAVGVGVALSGAYTIGNPPMAPQTVDVYLTSADGQFLAQDIKPGVAAQASWQFVVTTDIPSAQVQVSLPDLSQVPTDKAVYLTDLQTGKRMYARTMTGYSFSVGENGGQRRFGLEIAPKSSAGLVITNAVATGGQNGMAVTCSVSADCQITAQVSNIAGRVVRTLCTDKATQKGVSTLTWDLKNSRGTLVPNGRYIIRMTAASEDGQQVQAVTSATVQR